MNEKRVVITGGHFTPAYAVSAVLKENNWEMYWIGIDRAIEGEKVKTIEAKILPNLGIPFYAIDGFKLHRNAPIQSFLGIGKLFSSLFTCIKLLQEIKPQVVLSFGSFVSFPVCLAAWFLGIPIVIHEQTSASGLANRIVGELADSIAISFAESEKDFNAQKTVVTGNPVRKEIFEIAKKRSKKKSDSKLMLYITGGSRGSQAINTAVLECLAKLSKNYSVVHQAGDFDFERIKRETKNISSYKLYSTLLFSEVEKVFETCDVAISRSGANTVSELAALGIPAIFIPLPNAESDEQYKNAKLLENLGGAKIIRQTDLSGERLFEELENLRKNIKQYREKMVKAKALIPESAAQNIVNLMNKVTA